MNGRFFSWISRAAILAWSFAAQAALAEAPLRWDTTEISIDAPPMAESVEATFTFTNTTASPLTIAGVHSSCGCTVPELAKNTYSPGESGTIRAVFTIGERTGVQEKTITVATAAPAAATTVLLLRVTIPTLFEVSPYFLTWNNGEPPTPKAINLRLRSPDLLAVKSVESRHAAFSAAMAPTGDSPGNYTITVTPASTGTVTNGTIVVTLAASDGRTRSVQLYGLIRGAPAIQRAPASTTEPVRPGTAN